MNTIARSALAVFALCALAIGGCDAMRNIRPVSMEMSDKAGAWRLEGIGSVTLDKVGWQVRIIESKVNASQVVPRLEKIVIGIVNTSDDMPLMIASNAVTIDGIAGETAFMGPRKAYTLAQNDTLDLTYDPGLLAPVISYPFTLHVTIRRPGGDKETVTMKLY